LESGITTTIGVLAGICTTGSLLPQVIKTIRTRNTKDISLLMYVLLTIGVLLWVIYGCLLKEFPIIIANGTSLLLTVSVMALKIKHG
jgi:MtN3 and saliva related transmembrane protein